MTTTAKMIGQRCPRCRGIGRVVTDDVLGRAMKAKRIKAELSQKDVAAQMHVSPGHLCDLEMGRRHWIDTMLQGYEDALTVLANGDKR